MSKREDHSSCAKRLPFDATHSSALALDGQLAWTLGCVVLIWTVAAGQWMIGDLVVPWDSKNQFYAFFRFMAQSLASGQAPFWNPYHYGGHPSVADPQSLIFSPPFVLLGLFNPRASLRAFDLVVYAHLLIGGISLAIHGRRLGWPVAACVVAATIFMLGGPASGRLNHVGVITSYALFPLALLLLHIALERLSLLASLCCGLVIALIALGRSQVPFLLCFVLFAFLLAALVRGGKSNFVGRFVHAGVIGLVALVILAIPILLTLQFAEYSNRPAVDLEDALRSSLHPANFANLFVANIFGSLAPISVADWGPTYATLPASNSTDRSFNYLFAGSLPALLLFWFGVAGGGALQRNARLFTGIAIASLLFSLGRYSPTFSFLFEYVPGVSFFRRPVDAAFILILAIAYLSGHLLDQYVRSGLPRLSKLATAMAAALAGGAIVWAIAFSIRSDKGFAAVRAVAETAPIYLCLGLVFWLGARSLQSRLIAVSVVAAIHIGDIGYHNAASSLNAEPRAAYAMLEQPTGDAAVIIGALRREIKRYSANGVRPRVEIVGLGGPWQNASMIYGFEATNGYNPLRIGFYDTLVAPGEGPYTVLNRRFPASFPDYGSRLSRLLGLEFVILDRPIEQMPLLKNRGVANIVMAGPRVWIYRFADVDPRVTLKNVVRLAAADVVVDSGNIPANLGQSDVVVDDSDALSQNYAMLPGDLTSKAEILRWRLNEIEIATQSRTAAILTLRAPWYPGWEVEVNGVAKPVLLTDLLFRGVEVPPGSNHVVFRFRPLSWRNLSDAAKSIFSED